LTARSRTLIFQFKIQHNEFSWANSSTHINSRF
jgi:hypothetical protein